MEGFTKKQVAEITGLGSRLVQYYTEEGVVTPEIDRGEGRGRVRRYSKNNLYEFVIIKHLTEYGLTLEALGTCVQFVRETLMGCVSLTGGTRKRKVERLSSRVWKDKHEVAPIKAMEDGRIFENRDVYFVVEQDMENKLTLSPRLVNKNEPSEDIGISGVDEFQEIGSTLILNLGKLYEKIRDV
jgi:DNA-binding transcriptional MerR regulator